MTSGRSAASMPATEWMRVTSSASRVESGGRIPGSRRASIVFPSPAARRGGGCAPRGGDLERPPRPLLAADVGEIGCVCSRRRTAVALDVRLGLPLPPQVGRSLGEVPDGDRLDAGQSRLGRGPRGTENPRQSGPARRSASASIPPTVRAPVERELANRRVLGEPVARNLSGGARIDRAIGRSNPEPSLRSPAGARLTVIRRIGHSSSAETIPLRTRSLASWQARSARPTIANAGTAPWRCASTSTRRASSPTSACVTVRASMCPG